MNDNIVQFFTISPRFWRRPDFSGENWTPVAILHHGFNSWSDLRKGSQEHCLRAIRSKQKSHEYAWSSKKTHPLICQNVQPSSSRLCKQAYSSRTKWWSCCVITHSGKRRGRLQEHVVKLREVRLEANEGNSDFSEAVVSVSILVYRDTKENVENW